MRRLFPDPLDPVDPAEVYGDPPRTGPGGRPVAPPGRRRRQAHPGRPPDPRPAPLRLCSVCEQDGFLFLRYQPGAGR